MDQSHSLSHMRKYTLFQVTKKNGSLLRSYFKSYYKTSSLLFSSLYFKAVFHDLLRCLYATVYVCAYVCIRMHVCTCILHVHMCMSLNEDMQVLADIPCGARML